VSVRSELGECGAVVRRLVDTAGPVTDSIAAVLAERRIDFVMVAARGTSDHAAIYAQYVLGERNGLAVGLAAPSLASIYGRGPRLDRALVIGISQSGRSPDVVGVLEDGRRQGAATVAITNDPGSPLAEAAATVVGLEAGPELAVAATKTYVAELTVVALLSEALRRAGVGAGSVVGGSSGAVRRPTADGSADLAALPATLDAIVADDSPVAAVAGRWTGLGRCAVLARGYQYATAREWALKLKEIAGIAADPYSAADFEHGPIAMIGAGFPVLAVATDGPALAGMADLIGRLRDLGADLLVLSDSAEVRALGRDALSIPGGTPEWLAPIASIVPCQLFAYHLALAAGRDPEAPPNLRKVTLTR
jgi:glucosamine--fructose-6-phosphate aminotransferase (isomerizing)